MDELPLSAEGSFEVRLGSVVPVPRLGPTCCFPADLPGTQLDLEAMMLVDEEDLFCRRMPAELPAELR